MNLFECDSDSIDSIKIVLIHFDSNIMDLASREFDSPEGDKRELKYGIYHREENFFFQNYAEFDETNSENYSSIKTQLKKIQANSAQISELNNFINSKSNFIYTIEHEDNDFKFKKHSPSEMKVDLKCLTNDIVLF